VSEPERFGEAGFQVSGIRFARMTVGSHGMNDPAGREVEAFGRDCVADRQTIWQLCTSDFAACFEKLGPGGAMDGAVYTSASQK